jgi:hypothetical protein
MLHATQPNFHRHSERDAATVVMLLLVACAAGCQADRASRVDEVLLDADETVVEPLYAAAKDYNQRHSRRSYESPKPVAKDIVFVLDASGSMTEVLPIVVDELKRVVFELKSTDSATVICFSGRGIYEVDSQVGWSGLQRCGPMYKEEIGIWLTLFNHRFKRGGAGARFAEAAIVRAIRYKPDLIILLSDHLGGGGRGAARLEIDQDALLASIHAQNNVHKPTKINTIHFVNHDPLVDAGLRGTLERIADETDGHYRFFGRGYLNLR